MCLLSRIDQGWHQSLEVLPVERPFPIGSKLARPSENSHVSSSGELSGVVDLAERARQESLRIGIARGPLDWIESYNVSLNWCVI
jgi:hypothetical protein